MPENSSRPRKRPNRTNAMAASVPSTVAAVADNSAMRSVTQADSSMARSAMSSAYHRVDQRPPTRHPPAPHGDKPRGIERIDHQNDDRQIKEGKSQRDRADVEPRRLAHGQRPPVGSRVSICL